MAIKKQILLDPLVLDPISLKQTSKYIKDGLTVVSNNTDIIPRDENGNIIVQSGSYMVIETNSFNFDSKPMLDILDTRFNYFSFPVQITSNPVDIDVNFDFDNVSAKYIIPQPTDSKGQPQNYQRINTSYTSSWYYNDGTISEGYKALQFTGGIQENVNSYTITEDAFNTLKQQNKTLKFTIQIQWRSSTSGRTGFRTQISRRNPKNYNPLPVPFTIYKEQGSTPSGVLTAGSNPFGFNDSGYPFLQLTYIVDMNNTFKGDVYTINNVSGNPSWILAENCSWDIDIVDIPNPADNLYENVYSINQDTVILDSNGAVRVRRTAANGNVTTVE
jgi:hypothetical protein